MAKNNQPDLPDDIQEIVNMRKTDFYGKPSSTLEEFRDTLEDYVLSEVTDNFKDMEPVFDYHEKLADRLFIINNVLRQRRGHANTWDVDELNEQVQDNREMCEGQQTAIDKLKKHGHDGEVKTGNIVYP